jgi:hypothetical protein
MATGAADGADEHSLACDMIEVHGAQAAIVARDNARTAALAGQRTQAKSWIRVLGIIQRRRTDIQPPSDRAALEEAPHRPWVVPGVGGSF